MTLDARLRRLYASAPDGERVREGVTLSHPGFSRAWHMTDERDEWSGDDGAGVLILYRPGPIAVIAPGQDESGRGEMPIRIACDPEVCRELNAAAALASEPLRLVARRYLVGETAPRLVIATELTGVEVDPDGGVIAGVAAMPGLDGLAFPRLRYREQFPGLDRA